MKIFGEDIELPDALLENCLNKLKEGLKEGEIANGNIAETTLYVVLDMHRLLRRHDRNPMMQLGRFAKAYPALFWPLLIVLFVILSGASAAALASLGLQWIQ